MLYSTAQDREILSLHIAGCKKAAKAHLVNNQDCL